MLIRGNPPAFCDGFHLFIPPTAIGSVPSLSGHAIAYRWRRSMPRVRRYRVSSPQGSSSNGCCLFRNHHGPIFVRLSFPHTHCWYVVDICDCYPHKVPEAVFRGVCSLLRCGLDCTGVQDLVLEVQRSQDGGHFPVRKKN